MEQQHRDLEQTGAELDEEEARQMSQLEKSVQAELSAEISAVDKRFFSSLKNQSSVSDADVQKIMKLHKAEMKEFDSQFYTFICTRL